MEAAVEQHHHRVERQEAKDQDQGGHEGRASEWPQAAEQDGALRKIRGNGHPVGTLFKRGRSHPRASSRLKARGTAPSGYAMAVSRSLVALAIRPPAAACSCSASPTGF